MVYGAQRGSSSAAKFAVHSYCLLLRRLIQTRQISSAIAPIGLSSTQLRGRV
jgi:hypothetical protein